MLEYADSYDFGGLTAVRHIKEPKLAGQSGYLFVFIVRQRITHQDGDECLFRFAPVFVLDDGTVSESAASAVVGGEVVEDSKPPARLPDCQQSFRVGKEY